MVLKYKIKGEQNELSDIITNSMVVGTDPDIAERCNDEIKENILIRLDCIYNW